jgi:hypothetical protein
LTKHQGTGKYKKEGKTLNHPKNRKKTEKASEHQQQSHGLSVTFSSNMHGGF